MPFDLSNYTKLVAHIRAISIWLDFVNGGSAGAKSKRGVRLVNNLSLLVGDDSAANVFRREIEDSHR